jgi:hypoxanthine phosphoribosyltransferase
LLDFYGIAWEYEPRTFTLETDRAGNPVHAFTPDFYLPAYDLYIEITTLNQKLVTKKNRKARRLRELHPEVQIKVLYQRDYLHLLVKYGLEPPSQLTRMQGTPRPLDLFPPAAETA